MIHPLIISLLKDVSAALKKQPDALKNPDALSPVLAAVLKGMSEQDLLEALKQAVLSLQGNGTAQGNKLLTALNDYFVAELSSSFDQLGSVYFQADAKEQRSQLEKLFPGSGSFETSLRAQIFSSSPQEFSEHLISFGNEVASAPRVLVQSPADCDQETKKAIRAHFLQQYPHSFVSFQVNVQLIGGIRFFVDGKVSDHSWFSRIQSIRKLKTLV